MSESTPPTGPATTPTQAPSVIPPWAAGDAIGAAWPVMHRFPLMGLAARMSEVGAVRFGTFTLASGTVSDHYFDVKRLLLDPRGLADASALIGHRLATDFPTVTAVGGPEVGVIPLVGGILVANRMRQRSGAGWPPSGFIVRKAAKGYGTGNRIEGAVTSGSVVALVEDVTTTAASVVSAIDAVEAIGARVAVVFVVVNRGGDVARKAVEDRGAVFLPLLDSTAVLGFIRPLATSSQAPSASGGS